ncbi:TRAP transporter substrate-binding protein [Desulfoluna butyratoxydans]|uniref:Trap transporter solute receptor dctp/teaa n=1 Tax=Desulfoluna butyratoxydans TaxID=231438 RepID=A0A4U8YL30_9BACT|nr:TRAP transporter substrate-binding protein [Desulfoluna butyratoxydans]VFQ44237.1 trap transporter solute receptor dctp/teaa [Desulfoluna butyratoxydans]
MTRHVLRCSCLLLAGALALALFSTPAAAKTWKLTYSVFFPASHGQAKAAEAWAREVENQSNGRIKITVFPGGTLTNAKNCYDGVTGGISDIGMSVFAYNRGRFPVMEACDLPMGYPDGLTASRVVNAYHRAMAPKELDKVKVLYLHAHGPGLLHTKKPVASLADLKGLKIRSTGLSAKVVKALGAVPVAMPQGSTYEALQKGVVEGTFGPVEVLKGWRQAEVISSTTLCKTVGYTTTMYVVMNKRKWNALPADLQTILEQTSARWVDVHGKAWDELDTLGMEASLARGNRTVELSKEENAAWKEAVRPVVTDYITRASEQGLDGTTLVKTLKRIMALQLQARDS